MLFVNHYADFIATFCESRRMHVAVCVITNVTLKQICFFLHVGAEKKYESAQLVAA